MFPMHQFVLSQVIKWSTSDGGCTDFAHNLKTKIEKIGTLKENGDPKSEKGPQGDQCGSSGYGTVPNIVSGKRDIFGHSFKSNIKL